MTICAAERKAVKGIGNRLPIFGQESNTISMCFLGSLTLSCCHHTNLGLHDWYCTSSATAGHRAKTSVSLQAHAATDAKHMVLSA